MDRTLVHHNRESEAGMSLGFRHDQLCCLIDAVVRPVPVNNDSVDPAADHVGDLPVDLAGVGGTVADIHVVRAPEPQQQVGVDLRRCPGVKQRVHIHFTHVPRRRIAILLAGEIIGSAAVIRRLCGQSGCRYDGASRHAYTCR